MKLLALSVAALALSACAPIANTSNPLIVGVALDESYIGGVGYPVVITGAESVGLSPDAVAQSLRFPPSLRGGSSFRAVADGPGMVNHAHLDIRQNGGNATSTLTFLHGERRIGVGTFTLAREAYANPRALGSISSGLIGDMLNKARNQLREDDQQILLFR